MRPVQDYIRLLLASLVLARQPANSLQSQVNRFLIKKITRMHRKNPTSNPYVFGTTYDQDSAEIRKFPRYVKIDDGPLLFAETDSRYAYPLAPGQHYLAAFYLGSFIVRVNELKLRAGDSVRVDFYLRPTMEKIP